MFPAHLSLGRNYAEFPYFYLKPPAGQYGDLTTIYKTINYEGIICPLSSLIITPLFSDTNPKQAVALIANRGDRPAWGLITNAKRLNPAKAFQAKVWVPQKKNQILCNAFLTAPMACITPVILDKLDPTAAVLYYNSIGFMDGHMPLLDH
jgi:hypothetical protein